MGQESSKPPPSSTQHVFASETPVRFSPELINALEASPETDSTRAKDLELHIQSRVAAELSRLSASHSAALAELADQISASDDSTTSSKQPSPQTTNSDQSSAKHRAEQEGGRDLGRESVQREIENLKVKLKGRRMREDVVEDKEVKRVKEKMVGCLRLNDRRPLDCWEEVEAFKREVGRLEKVFLGRVME